MISSALLHGPCTPSGSCGLVGCRSLPCNRFPCGRSVEAHLCRSGLVGFYYIHRPSANWWYFPPSQQIWTLDSPTFEALCSSADDELFTKTNHILHSFLPPLSTASQSYSLRRRTLDIQPIFRTVTSSPACCTKTIRHYVSFVCMYMPGECFLMTVWRSLLCSAQSAVRCLHIWLFILLAAFCDANFTIKLN